MTTPPVTDETSPATKPSAVVIPFPARPTSPVVDPQVRLGRALASLEAALASQRAALAGWRDVLKELKSTTTTLDESLQRYRSSLRSLGSGVNALHQKAKTLEAWADKAGEMEH